MTVVAKELAANYDQAVWDWCGTLRVDYGRTFGAPIIVSPKDLSDWPIFRVFSSPERAFSDLRNAFKAQGFYPDDYWKKLDQVSEDQILRIPAYPMCRIQQMDVLPVTGMHQTPARLRFWDSTGLTWNTYKAPTPYEIVYSIDFVSMLQRTGVYIKQWFLSQFTPPGASNNTRYLNVQHPSPWGVHVAPLTFDSFSDNSDLESSADEERTIRWTATVRLRAWNFDNSRSSTFRAIKAITGFRMKTYAGPWDLNIDDFGELVGTTPLSPDVILDEKPLPAIRTAKHTNATRYVVREGFAPQYVIDDDAKFVEVTSIPFRSDELVQGDITILWRRNDVVDDPGPLTVRLVWRDQSSNDAATVVQEFSLPYDADGATIQYTTLPGAESKEVGIRILKDDADDEVRLSVIRNRMARVRFVNLVDSGDRTKGPGLGTTTNVSITGVSPGAPYAVRGWVNVNVQTVTVRLYADAAATELIDTAVFTADGEFSFYGTPKDSFTLRITTPSADTSLVVNGITCAVCLSRPLAGGL